MIRSLRIVLLAVIALIPLGMATAQETREIAVTGYPLYAKAITPHDTNVLTNHAGNPQDQYVYVGVAGNVTCTPSGNANGQEVTFVGLAAGSFVPVRCRRVMTSTTATNLIGIF